MRLTTKGRYAVTAMLDLAIHATESPVPLADISQRQGISLSYLEQLFARLRRQGLVKSARGPGGGYRLNREADDITIVEVLNAIDEKIDATRCAGKGDCQDGQACLTHDLWADLSKQISDFLGGISLGELMERRTTREVSARQDALAAHPVTLV
jgi:Rrf2 family iron-sulfur cluster assembly transcriptional regulator